MAIERIQLRRGTASQWTSSNPILAPGEVGVELGSSNTFKIGDGSSTWTELDYFTAGIGDSIPSSEKGSALGVATLDATGAIPSAQLANIIDSAPATLDTLNELATALGDDANFATTILSAIGEKADLSAVSGKADLNHSHTISDVTSLQASLDSKASLSSSPTFSGTVTAPTFSGTATNASKIDNRSLFVQSSAPSSGMVSGDIWIKTA